MHTRQLTVCSACAEHTLGCCFIQQLFFDGRCSSSSSQQRAGLEFAACRVTGSPASHLASPAHAWAAAAELIWPVWAGQQRRAAAEQLSVFPAAAAAGAQQARPCKLPSICDVDPSSLQVNWLVNSKCDPGVGVKLPDVPVHWNSIGLGGNTLYALPLITPALQAVLSGSSEQQVAEPQLWQQQQ